MNQSGPTIVDSYSKSCLVATIHEKAILKSGKKIVSTAVVSLRIEGESVGILFVNYRHGQDFKAPQRNFVRGLANFAAIAIYNNRQFQNLYKNRLAELEAFRQIDLDISKSLRLADVLQAILKRASEIVRGDEASIYLYNAHTQQLETEVSFGPNKEKYQQHKVRIDGPGLVPWVYRNKQQARVSNVKTDPQWRAVYHPLLDQTRSELDVPLLKHDEVVGVISFESAKEGAFSEGNEDFLVTLAGQAVLAIKEAQLTSRLRNQGGVWRSFIKKRRKSSHSVAIQRGLSGRSCRRPGF